MDIKSKIRMVPDHPKPGIMFYDITTLLLDPKATKYCIDTIIKHFKGKRVDLVVGAESRGFIFGALVADKMNVPFAPIRKRGKLPAAIERVEYQTEYSMDCIEIHRDAIKRGDQVLVIDDLAATGGTALAQAVLIEKLGGKVAGFGFVIELVDLKPREKLKGYDVFSVVQAEGG